jgi:hypothetical protein
VEPVSQRAMKLGSDFRNLFRANVFPSLSVIPTEPIQRKSGPMAPVTCTQGSWVKVLRSNVKLEVNSGRICVKFDHVS